MSDVLILKSVDGNPLTEQFLKKCLDANEMFIAKKTFSPDRSSVELTFIDEESLIDLSILQSVDDLLILFRSRDDLRFVENLLCS